MSNNYPKYDQYAKYEKGKKLSLYERFGMFFQNSKRIIKIANKPGRKDYFLVFKICAIGILVLGALSYVIQLIWTLINALLGIR
ncbi:MAG: protein translocase SEC61 complex subunit gamma [Candidatus Lokiarchaeota archaeon]|nr:protein translocase SEC61 complex subunit gamma [Candidatus Lokiarchaeota archaeon]